MAVGMHATALGSLGPNLPEASDLALFSDTAEPVEISLLSESRSQQAARALQQRSLQARPMAKFDRMIKCKQRTSEAEAVEQQQEAGSSHKAAKPLPAGNALSKLIFEVLPILSWLPQVTWPKARSDLIAGLTVGVMAIPQSMSYASIAGLPYIYGLYSACLPPFIYAIFGQSRQLAVGPVAMVSLLISAGLEGQLSEEQCPEWFALGGLSSGVAQRSVCPDEYVQMAILTAAVAGVMQILGMILRLGFLVSFLGHPVTSGFTSAAAITIALSQIKGMFGISIEKSELLYVTIDSFVRNVQETKLMTLFLGLACLCFLLLCKHASKRWQRFSMLGPLGPLLCCAASTLLVWRCEPLREQFQVQHVGYIPSGIFPESVTGWNFGDVLKVLPTALAVCAIGYMESIAIGKNLAAKHGHEIEAGQELLALGLSNLIGAMFSCYPVTGSFSRSAVSHATGASTQLCGVVTGTVILFTLLFLTPLFYFLPGFVLAAIVISSVLPLVAYQEPLRLWRVKRHDCILWLAAFLGTLFLGVLPGILLAVGLSLLIVIYESVRPQITILWRIPGTTIYRNVKQESSGVFIPNVFMARLGSSMYFANASFIKDMLLAYVADLEDINSTEYIILEMSPVVSVDSTAVHVLEDVVTDFRRRGIQVAFAMVGNRVSRTMQKAGLTEFIGERWFFATVHDAVVGCLRHQKAKRRQQTRLPSVSRRTIYPVEGFEQFSNIISERSAGVGSREGESAESADLESQRHSEPQSPVVGEVQLATEVGFSNDLHHLCTVFFINLAKDIPMIMSHITAVFQRRHITVCRAHVEAMDEFGVGRAQHAYHVLSLRDQGKLQVAELQQVKAELEELIRKHLGTAEEPLGTLEEV
ncbi:unnamed protein product [Polarella glacialis]|uniref:STAS domain-containing protein n=2 Tax=Polarella glacialis TaxID=89957 RepID=A0A813EWP2_POLGL|nr:unnamed protein product [Polarella glacialis]|eukprot:CAMPEP_0115103598 /NCGR_PEP_ID=MMETSP0227-20121206/34720_1 /TAXON_ID=89957 /ORGANISM="Polarella glacialis, Strain CCMP 1383" /LENGTH=869 /DNA_ID=CAMNT_0002500165 /DNA_START=156 /DNA_END=2765 /DNA_ORIENTATION=-